LKQIKPLLNNSNPVRVLKEQAESTYFHILKLLESLPGQLSNYEANNTST